jgi:DNA-binding NtrC family response regulator
MCFRGGKMINNPSITLVCDKENLSYWKPMVGKIQTAMGPVEIVLEDQATEKGLTKKCDLVVFDVSEVANLPSLIDSIREYQPECRILIVTAAPTWKKAREALRHGATDYIRKPSNSEEMITAFRTALQAPLSLLTNSFGY